MKREHVEQLSKVYSGDQLDEQKFEKSLGIYLKETWILISEIYNSFDKSDFGIGWWKSYENLSFEQRILISDQLYQSIYSIQSNITEAKLHLIELLGEWEKENRSYDEGVQYNKGQFSIKHPLKTRPLDDLTSHMADLHLKGFLGSLTAAIDCMAAVVVGITGIRLEIYKVGFSELENHAQSKHFSYGNKTQKKVFEKIDKIVSSAGPSGWKRWLFDYRNMVLHRGRRIQFTQFDGRETGVLSPKGEEIIRTNLLRSLVKDPRLSNVESMRKELANVLTEHAEVTLEEILRSSIFLIEEISKELLLVWTNRKTDHKLIEQPPEQWPKVRQDTYDFEGFSPNTLNWNVSLAFANETVLNRIEVASLADKDSENWKSLDKKT